MEEERDIEKRNWSPPKSKDWPPSYNYKDNDYYYKDYDRKHGGSYYTPYKNSYGNGYGYGYRNRGYGYGHRNRGYGYGHRNRGYGYGYKKGGGYGKFDGFISVTCKQHIKIKKTQ